MNNEIKFLEKLNGLKQTAQQQGSQITIEEVKAYFSEELLTEEQMELVFDYLLSQKIVVKGYINMWTNFEEEVEEKFTDEEKQNVLGLFDLMDSENLIGSVIELIPKDEFSELVEMLKVQQNNNTVYKQSTAYLVSEFINVLPRQMEKVADIVNNFDPSKYQAVVDFATAANGGRNINTQTVTT